MDDCFKFSDICIRFSIKGEGPAIVLLHGYTESRQIWVNFADSLSKHYTVITPDLPGHGESDFLPDLSMDKMADAIYALLEHLEIDEYSMIGHSMGGYITLQYVKKFPDKINGFGLFHSNASADSLEIKENRFRTIEIINKNYNDFLTNFIPDLFFEGNRDNLKEEILFLQKLASKMNAKALVAAQKAMAERTGSLGLLSETTVPVLFIIGKQDSRVDFNKVLAQTVLPKKTFVLILDQCGHMGYLEAPKETLAAIYGFLRACNS